MKDLNDWSCEALVGEKAPLTVGFKFAILCRGTKPLEILKDQSVDLLKILPKNEDQGDNNNPDPNSQFHLVPLKLNFKSEYEVSVLATSWKVGNYKFEDYQLILDDHILPLKGPDIKVKSTLQKNQEMNSPPGPAQDPIPQWVGAGILFIGLYFIFRFLKAYIKGRRCDRGMLQLSQFKTGLSPYFEFQRQMRLIQRDLESIELHKNLEDRKQEAEKLAEVCENFRKTLEAFVSLKINKPLFVLNSREGREEFKKNKISNLLIKNYYEIEKELKSVIRDLGFEVLKKKKTSQLEFHQRFLSSQKELTPQLNSLRSSQKKPSSKELSQGLSLKDQDGKPESSLKVPSKQKVLSQRRLSQEVSPQKVPHLKTSSQISSDYMECKRDLLILVGQSRKFADQLNKEIGA